MQIAIVAPNFPPTTGGESEYAAQVALELLHRGHQVVVFTWTGNVGRDEGYEVRDVLQGRQSANRSTIQGLCGFDVIHVMNAAWSWVSRFGKPTFLSIHGNDFIDPNPVYGYDLRTRLGLPKGDRLDFWLAAKRTRVMMRKCLPLCRVIFSNSDYTKDVFLQKYPLCQGQVIRAGVGVGSKFIDGPTSLRRETSVGKLLTVCRLSEPRKNVDLILRALARLKSEFAFRYTIVGEGDLRRDLTNLSVKLGLSDRVNFAGKVGDADLRSYYENADLFVLPSGISETSFEGFGITYLEANSLGVPTMAVRAGGAQEAVDEGRSGFFVEAPTVAAIEIGLREFLLGEKTFRSQDCRRFAAQFTWARVVDKFEQAYKAAKAPQVLRVTETATVHQCTSSGPTA
jgi:glycosyltransferase involved in cell wall biosynthesis